MRLERSFVTTLRSRGVEAGIGVTDPREEARARLGIGLGEQRVARAVLVQAMPSLLKLLYPPYAGKVRAIAAAATRLFE